MLQMIGRPIAFVTDLLVDGLDWLARNCVHIRWNGMSDHSRHPLDEPFPVEPQATLWD